MKIKADVLTAILRKMEARGLIRRNADALGVIGQVKIWRRDATRLGPCAPQPGFDLAFADPPYGKELGERALKSAREGGWLKPGALCDKCEGEDHNKPIEGMVIMWGMNADGEEEYSGGKIFDPAKNKTYRCSMWIKDGKLMVRGYLGPFYRTQTWHAVD